MLGKTYRLQRQYLEENATWRPDETAVTSVDSETDLSYLELDQAANQFANALHEKGLRQGDMVALALYNTLEFPIALYACHKRGFVPVALNYRFAVGDFQHALLETNPEAIVYDTALGDRLQNAIDRTEWEGVMVSSSETKRADSSFETLLECGNTERPDMFARSPEEISYMFYTSGTSGDPKAVAHTPRSCTNRISMGIASTRTHAGSICLGLLPLFHGGGMDTVLRTCIAVGATLLLTRERDPERLLDIIEQHEVTDVRSVPTLTQRFLDVDDLSERDLSSVEAWRNGGTVLTETEARAFRENITPKIFNAYGTSESGTNVVLEPQDLPAHAGTVGKPLPDTDVRVVEHDPGRRVSPTETVPQGEPGEVLLRSPQLFHGYFENETETRERVREGWYYTHDIGRVDQDGYLRIEGRTDDMILSGGELIPAVEVEEVLEGHSAVASAIVVGQQDEEWGEIVKAYVVPTEPSDKTTIDLVSYCRNHESLADYKRPREIEWITEIEYNEMGKKLRSELR